MRRDFVKTNIKKCSIFTLLIAFTFLTNYSKAANGNSFVEDTTENAFDPIYSYIIFATIFLAAIFIFSYFKQKEEKLKSKKKFKSHKQVHFTRQSRRQTLQKAL